MSPKLKGRVMSLSPVPTVDELLADGLVQAVMQADHVEPAQLKKLLSGVAGRIARRRQSEQKALRVFAIPRLEWRLGAVDANDLARALPATVAEGCVAGLCC
jgi:hypothetical protein